MKNSFALFVLLLGLLSCMDIVNAQERWTPDLNFSYAEWAGQTYRTFNEPPKEILDEFKEKIIESGISEQYFDEHFVLIFASQEDINEVLGAGKMMVERRTIIDAYYWWKTNSWLDEYYNEGGAPAVTEVEPGRYYALQLHMISYSDLEGVVYSLHGIRTWHNDTLVKSEGSLHEIKDIISYAEAEEKLYSCVKKTDRKPLAGLKSDRGKGLKVAFFAIDEYKQAIVDLETGELICKDLEVAGVAEERLLYKIKKQFYYHKLLFVVFALIVISLVTLLLIWKFRKRWIEAYF